MREKGPVTLYLLHIPMIVIATFALVWGDAFLSQMKEPWPHVIRFSIFLGFSLLILQLVIRIHQLKQQELLYGSINPGTGIYKKQAFVALVERELLRAERSELEFSVMSLAMQMTASIQDKMTRRDLSRLQKSMIAIVKASSRKTDVLAHVEGDAFALFMPETNGLEMKMVADRITKRFQTQVGRLRGATVCIGGVTGAGGYRALDIIRAADEQLYLAMQETNTISLHHLVSEEKGVS